ncbi:MAG TPA: type II toxin-antitoxin system VapC family toxin [Thermoanaerobaculia bacterium]|nr:type II toxin-antitoxin system VapC family toxin [Thermoanaerobaculia bacterium]
MIVVDTNVLAYLWLPGERTQASERLLKRDPDWNAPLLWRSEFRNVLAGCLRRGDLSLQTALQIADGAEGQMSGREFTVPSAQVLARAHESDCSAYDCEFVALADELGVSLITSDDKLLKSFPRITRPLG